jgi:glycosyltransferase involved in cell wall biosynthesis
MISSVPQTDSFVPEILLVSADPVPGRLKDPTVTVVIPALNEAKNLAYVLPRIPRSVYEVILVDGNSVDDTVEVAQNLYPGIRIVAQTGRGKGNALRAGFAAATGDIIVMLDADGSTDPAEIPAFVGPLLAGADFVKGSRFLHGGGTADMSGLRRVGNLGFLAMVHLLFGGNFTDLCYGYNAFWRRVLPKLNLDGDGFEIETIMNVHALQAGLKIVEIASFEHERVHGVSRLRTFPDGWRVTKAIFREAFNGAQSDRMRTQGTKTASPTHGVRFARGYAVAWTEQVAVSDAD